MRTNRKKLMLVTAGAAVLAVGGLFTNPQPIAAGTGSGDLDTTYGTDGFEDLGTPGGAAERVAGLAAQGDLTAVDRSDFRVYLAQVGDQIVVGRLAADGQPDTGTEWNGNWTHDGSAGEIATDDDDRIYVSGDFLDASGNSFATVARLLPDGQLDTSYGSQGFADLGGGSIAVSPGGEVHIVGTATDKGKLRWAAWRLDSDGDEDTSFGKRGVWTSDFELVSNSPPPAGVRLDGTGNVLIFGQGPQSFSFDEIIVRLDSGGDLDTTFGVPPAATASARGGNGNGNGGGGGGGGSGGDDGGVVTLPSALVSAVDVLIGATDDIYVSGSVNLNPITQPSNWEPYVMHLDANGLVDTGFGNGTGDLAGVAHHPARSGTQGSFDMVIAQNRIVVTGAVIDSTTDHDVQLFAVDLNGDAVTTFGPGGDGLSEAGDTGSVDHAYYITVDAAGDLLVAGRSDPGGNQGNSHLLFARYCW